MLRYLVILVIMVLLTPFIFKKLGAKLYGVWSLILVFSNVPSMLELGAGTALLKFIPEIKSDGNDTNLNQLINFVIMFYALIGFVSLLILFLFKTWIITNILKADMSNFAEVNFVFSLSLLVAWFSFVLASYTLILMGFQRFDLFAIVVIMECVVRSGLTFLFLEYGWGLKGLVFAGIGGLVTTWIMGHYFIKIVFSSFKLGLLWSSVRKFGRAVLSYGIKMAIPGIVLWQQFDKAFLGYFLNSTMVGYYQLGNSLAKQFRNLPDYLVYPIFPTACELNACDDKKRIKELYFQTQKYNFLILLPLFFLGFIFAPLIIQLWLGKGLNLVVLTFRVFLAAYFIFQTSVPSNIILNAIGFPQEGMKASILSAIIILVLCPLFISEYGFAGALFSVAISIIAFSVWVQWIFYFKAEVSFVRMLKECFSLPAIVVILLGTILIFVNHFTTVSLLYKALAGLFFTAFYFIIIWLSSHFNPNEKQRMKNGLRNWLGLS